MIPEGENSGARGAREGRDRGKGRVPGLESLLKYPCTPCIPPPLPPSAPHSPPLFTLRKHSVVSATCRRRGGAGGVGRAATRQQQCREPKPHSGRRDSAAATQKRPLVGRFHTIPRRWLVAHQVAKMKGEWKDVELAVIDYRETGTYVIRVDEQVVQQLDDHIVMSQSMEHQVLFHRVADRHLPKLTPRARGAHGVGPGPPANAGAGRVPGRGGRGAPTDSTGSRGPGGLRARGLAAPRPATAAARRRTGCGCGGPPPRRGGSGPLLRSRWGSVRPRGTGMGSTSCRTASGARRHTQIRRRPSPSGPAAPRAR